MKDLYTFDVSEQAALATYQSVRAEYRLFFDYLGVPYVEVEASSGNMGGSLSHEYHFLSPLGEDTIIICESCGFAANEEILEKKAEGQENHQCPRCTGHKISTHRAIEVGHTFHLGTRYSEPLEASVTLPTIAQPNVPTAEVSQSQASDTTIQTSSTDRVPLQMGCHGIGVSRLVGAVAAMTADEKGLSWPLSMAPYPVVVVFHGTSPPVNPDFPHVLNDYVFIKKRLSSILHKGLLRNGKPPEVVFDDRDKPLAWKMKDADLVGYPVIIVIGKSFKESGKYEIQCRSTPKLTVTSENLATSVAHILNQLTPRVTENPPWQPRDWVKKPFKWEEYNEWSNKNDSGQQSQHVSDRTPATISHEDHRAGAIIKPTQSLAQNVGNKEEPQTLTESQNNFQTAQIQYVTPLKCSICGTKRESHPMPI